MKYSFKKEVSTMDQRPGFKAYYLDASSSSIPSDWSGPHESMDEHHKFSVNLKNKKKKREKPKIQM